MIKRYFSPPVFENDEERTRTAKLLHQIILSSWVLPLLSLIVIFLNTSAKPFVVPAGVIVGITLIILILLNRSGRVQAASTTLIVMLVIVFTYLDYATAGGRSPLLLLTVVAIVMSGLLLGNRAPFVVAIALSVEHSVMIFLNARGIIKPLDSPPAPLQMALVIAIAYLLIAYTLRLAISRIQSVVYQIRESERDLQASNRELQSLSQSLEKRVDERTKELSHRSQELESANAQIQRRASQFEALAQVTRSITSVRDLQDLLPRITTVVSDKFGFYHVGIFLLDEISEYAVLIAANSAGGKRMLERNHRLRVGEEGIVGYAASTGKPRIALDVGQDAVYFNNPDLPETHSEMALPLISKNIIVGVLDVQSTETAAFSKEDIQMLSLLADQVSLAIENARLFGETRKALAEAEMMTRRSTRDAWARLPEQQKLLGYRYDVAGSSPLRQPIKLTRLTSGDGKHQKTESAQTIVPIELRGEIIGELVVQSPSGKRWSEDQIDLIKAVAERVALSAENARLFEETNARADRERLVSEITSKIRSNNDPQSMIQTAIQELRGALGASRVDVIPQSGKGPDKDKEQGKVNP